MFLISCMLILLFSKNGAPKKDLGFFLVINVTDSNSFFSDFIPSSPTIAPDGMNSLVPNFAHASVSTSKIDSSPKCTKHSILVDLFCFGLL